MMKQVSIDLETLGTNTDSQILSIGACVFNLKTGRITDEFYRVIELPENSHLAVTAGTLEFWLMQGLKAKEAIWGYPKTSEIEALVDLISWLGAQGPFEIWANGTKFDLGMLEYDFKRFHLPVPWKHNADRCLRTLRKFAGDIEMEHNSIPHHALHDAIWQARYISAACNKLGLV